MIMDKGQHGVFFAISVLRIFCTRNSESDNSVIEVHNDRELSKTIPH